MTLFALLIQYITSFHQKLPTQKSNQQKCHFNLQNSFYYTKIALVKLYTDFITCKNLQNVHLLRQNYQQIMYVFIRKKY